MTLTAQREEPAALQQEWVSLLARLPEPAPFLHPTWLKVWLEEFQDGRELILLAVRDGDALAGVAPLLRQDSRLAFAGHYSICDYMDFVVPAERSGDVFSALLEALLQEPWSELELRGLRDGSPTLAELPALAQAAGLAVEREQEAVAPRVELAESWDAYLAALPKKDRHELRRKLRRIQAAGELELRTYTAPPDIEEHLPLLLRLMVDSRSDKAAFMSEQMGRFFHRMAQALSREGLIRLYELELDRKPVASLLCFDMSRQLFMYNSGYDPEYAGLAVGLISKALCLRDATEAGYRRIDFLRGHEPYKYDLGARDQTVYRCRIKRG
ncbi:MAG: GNAT family N-acetyltransferase [Chloroflexi bacterium]|nr:GNAT family N-acetyltransferase [Chloroflexota bacterium]